MVKSKKEPKTKKKPWELIILAGVVFIAIIVLVVYAITLNNNKEEDENTGTGSTPQTNRMCRFAKSTGNEDYCFPNVNYTPESSVFSEEELGYQISSVLKYSKELDDYLGTIMKDQNGDPYSLQEPGTNLTYGAMIFSAYQGFRSSGEIPTEEEVQEIINIVIETNQDVPGINDYIAYVLHFDSTTEESINEQWSIVFMPGVAPKPGDGPPILTCSDENPDDVDFIGGCIEDAQEGTFDYRDQYLYANCNLVDSNPELFVNYCSSAVPYGPDLGATREYDISKLVEYLEENPVPEL